MSVPDIYPALFAKDHIQDGDVISLSEHGRVGGVSTGQGFKHISIVDKDTGIYEQIVNDKADVNNSTETLLLADAVFTGTGTDTFGYSYYTVMVHADVVGTLAIQYSDDNSDWHDGESYSIPADTTKFFTPPLQERYLRVVYTNGSSSQSLFHLHTTLRKNKIKSSSHNINDNLNDDDDAELNISVLKLRTAQDTYVSGASTNNGNFKMSLEEYNGQIATTGLPITWGNGSSDAFGRGRVSATGQRYDVEFIYDKQPLLVDEVTNNGTATHNTNGRDITLSLASANSGDKAELYSHFDIPYTAGNSQLIDITATLDNAGIGGGTAQLFLRSKISGSVVETVVDQTSWDSPVADVDWATSQIFAIDFQSLKVGRVRYYLVRDGMAIKVHEITNDNTRTTGYWQRPTLPLAWRLYCDATYTYMEVCYGDDENAVGFRYRISANASATMRAICGTVKSEGGKDLFDMYGFNKAIDMGITTKTVSTTLVPLISIRPSATFNSLTNRGLFIPDGWEVQGNNAIKIVLLYRPTLTGPSWTSVDATYSGMEYDVTASAVSGGIVVDSAYLATSGINARGKDEGLLGRTLLSLGRTGTADILTIAAIRTGNVDSATLAGLRWREIR